MQPESLPEERLLNLIRKKKGFSSPSMARGPSVSKIKWVRTLQEKGVDYLIEIINRLIFSLLLIFLAFLVYELVQIVRPKQKILKEISSVAVLDTNVSSQTDELPFSYYEQQFSQRDLFERTKKPAADPTRSFLIKRFKLVGIVLGSNPQAIVEDLENKQTLFVHQGDQIDGADIVSIQEGKIVLLYDEEEFELKQ